MISIHGPEFARGPRRTLPASTARRTHICHRRPAETSPFPEAPNPTQDHLLSGSGVALRSTARIVSQAGGDRRQEKDQRSSARLWTAIEFRPSVGVQSRRILDSTSLQTLRRPAPTEWRLQTWLNTYKTKCSRKRERDARTAEQGKRRIGLRLPLPTYASAGY